MQRSPDRAAAFADAHGELWCALVLDPVAAHPRTRSLIVADPTRASRTMTSLTTAPHGVGLGLRSEFAEALLRDPGSIPELAWLELMPENLMGAGGPFRRRADALRERFPIATHGVTLDLGGTDRFDPSHLRTLRAFLREVRAPWHSDHVSWSCGDGVAFHELFPLPFTRVSVARTVDRIQRARDALGVPLAVENISWYARPGRATLDEADFLTEIVERSGAGLLLDVNNVWVNARNHGFDPFAFVAALPLHRVVQIHVAGHDDPGRGRQVIDTHGRDVHPRVLDLLAFALGRTGPVPVLLERDQDIPSLEGLRREVQRIHAVLENQGAHRGPDLAVAC